MRTFAPNLPLLYVLLVAALVLPASVSAQDSEVPGAVRRTGGEFATAFTITFLPGKADEGVTILRDDLLPAWREAGVDATLIESLAGTRGVFLILPLADGPSHYEWTVPPRDAAAWQALVRRAGGAAEANEIVDRLVGLVERQKEELVYVRAAPEDTGAAPDSPVGVSDSLVDALLSEHDVPGAVVAVVEDGHVVKARGYGTADVESDVPLTARTPIGVASLSKPVTAWVVLRLAATGTIALDEPVERYVPEWSPPPGPYDPREITARRLLSHTAGLGMPAVPWFPADEPAPVPLDVLLGRTGDGEPVHLERAPGSGWSYSGGGYTVLQVLVEAVTGRPFGRFMRREIFEPLGMDDTGYGPREAEATGYDEKGRPIPTRRYVGTSAAGLRTTARDAARLLVAYHRAWTGRSTVVLGHGVLREAAEPVAAVELEGVEGAFYGLGHAVHRRSDGAVLLYHSGGNPGVRAYIVIEPHEGDGLFVAVNSDRGVPVVAAVREAWGAAHGGDLPPLY